MPFCTDYDLLLIAHNSVLFPSMGWRLQNTEKQARNSLFREVHREKCVISADKGAVSEACVSSPQLQRDEEVAVEDVSE